MRSKSKARFEVRLAPRERLTRGLKYSAIGPVDITRGALGVSVHSAQSAASSLRRRYEAGRLRHQLEAAQDVVANLPQALQDARRPKRRRRPLILAGVAAAAVLAGGAVAFSVIRRSSQHKEPSRLEPSVEVTPKP